MALSLRHNNHPAPDYNQQLATLLQQARIPHAVVRYGKAEVGVLPEGSPPEVARFFGVGQEGVAIMQGRVRWEGTVVAVDELVVLLRGVVLPEWLPTRDPEGLQRCREHLSNCTLEVKHGATLLSYNCLELLDRPSLAVVLPWPKPTLTISFYSPGHNQVITLLASNYHYFSAMQLPTIKQQLGSQFVHI